MHSGAVLDRYVKLGLHAFVHFLSFTILMVNLC